MLDNRTKNILDLNDIKEVMVETMLSKYNEKALTKNELTKFFKYMNLQQKNNTSKNSVDSRIESLYKAIQKQYDSFVKLNAIITELD
ncbi:MAG: hypothetical protein IKI95_00180 [Clostridia bacterium]|nr:hypothetical protein [Clostridia bacterium]